MSATHCAPIYIGQTIWRARSRIQGPVGERRASGKRPTPTPGLLGHLTMVGPALPDYEPLGSVPLDSFNLVYIIFYMQVTTDAPVPCRVCAMCRSEFQHGQWPMVNQVLSEVLPT
jgi:hypothetical protein